MRVRQQRKAPREVLYILQEPERKEIIKGESQDALKLKWIPEHWRCISTDLTDEIKTYTGATVVAGPGSVLNVGNADSAQACSTSALESPAGNVAGVFRGLVSGITSEQSINDLKVPN